jgi:hypothetical protein
VPVAPPSSPPRLPRLPRLPRNQSVDVVLPCGRWPVSLTSAPRTHSLGHPLTHLPACPPPPSRVLLLILLSNILHFPLSAVQPASPQPHSVRPPAACLPALARNSRLRAASPTPASHPCVAYSLDVAYTNYRAQTRPLNTRPACSIPPPILLHLPAPQKRPTLQLHPYRQSYRAHCSPTRAHSTARSARHCHSSTSCGIQARPRPPCR